MTDRFEEAVRQAARGLTEGADADMPTYHAAWERGRRRRFRKQAGLTFAGAVLLLGAVAGGLGNLPGRGGAEVDDVALDAEVATAAPVLSDEVATTEPLPSPPLPSTGPTATPPPVTSSAQADAPAAVEPVETPEPAVATEAPEAAAPTVAPPVATAVPATPEPTATAPAAEPQPGAQDSAQNATADGEPNATEPSALEPSNTESGDSGLSDSDTPHGGDPAAQSLATDSPPPAADSPPDDVARQTETPGLTAAIPNVTFIGPDQKPDATLLGNGADGAQLPCDRSGDAIADATCRLLPRYSCTGDGDVRPAYTAIDLDEDGELDTCVASGLTACDSTGDGLADTPCTIELENSPEDG